MQAKRLPDFKILAVAALAVIVIFLAMSQLINSLHVSGLEISLSRYSFNSERVNESSVADDNAVISSMLSSTFAGGYEYELAAKALSWQAYKQLTDNETELTKQYLLSSIRTRPTWYATYLELAQFESSDSSLGQIELARRFGPYMPLTLFAQFDAGFSRWNHLDNQQRVELSTNFLTTALKWKYRDELSRLLTYSQGAERMCRLLAFNNTKHEKCQTNING